MNDVMAWALLCLAVACSAFVGVLVATWWARRPQMGKRAQWSLTPDEQATLDRYDASPRGDEGQAAWDAMPLWLRVALCGECGWLDAVYESSPELGREIDARTNGYRTLDERGRL